MRYFLLLLLLPGWHPAFSQLSEVVNSFDSLGNKQGRWIIYLDKYWGETNDTAKAVCKRFTRYEHGTNVYPMGSCGKKGWVLVSHSENASDSSEINILHGGYEWQDKKGVIRSVHIFEKGNYISCKENDTKGRLQQFFEFNKKWKSQPHTWYISQYSKDKKKKIFVMRNGEYGWMLYQCTMDDF